MVREAIPALDLMGGECVRLEQGDFGRRKVYRSDPVAFAEELADCGIRRLHVVDLDGARTGRTVHHGVLEKICAATKLKVDFGGGVRNSEDLRKVLDAGAAYVALSSTAVLREDLFENWISEYGPGRFILCPDFSEREVRITGWAESTGLEVREFIGKFMKKGIKRFLCTDIRRDGMMKGPAFGLYAELLRAFPGIRLIASGGVSGKEDIETLFEMGAEGVVVGKALFEGAVTLKEISGMRRC